MVFSKVTTKKDIFINRKRLLDKVENLRKDSLEMLTYPRHIESERSSGKRKVYGLKYLRIWMTALGKRGFAKGKNI